jgi:hypothetical protein
MNTRREEEAIITDGHRERHICGRRLWALGQGRNRADAGAQITGIRGFNQVLRVLTLAQNVPCFLLKAVKMICCAIKSKFIAAGSKFHENND